MELTQDPIYTAGDPADLEPCLSVFSGVCVLDAGSKSNTPGCFRVSSLYDGHVPFKVSSREYTTTAYYEGNHFTREAQNVAILALTVKANTRREVLKYSLMSE